MDKKNQNFKKNKDTNAKIDKMRMILSDKEKCKEIARKLCDYISKKS